MGLISARTVAAAQEWATVRDVLRAGGGGPRRISRGRLRLHLRQPARDAAAGAGGGDQDQRRAAPRGLVRLQDQRARAARGDRRGPVARARPRLRARGRHADPGRLRGDRARLHHGHGRRRRGGDPGARLVLLRADAARRRPRPGPRRPRPRALRPRPRRHRGRDHAPDADGGGQQPAQPDRAHLPARGARGAGRPARDRLAAHRRPHLALVRRALPAHPLRRHRLHQPRRRLSLDDDRLQLRQGAARARASGSATWRSRRSCPPTRGRRCATRCSRRRWRWAGPFPTR